MEESLTEKLKRVSIEDFFEFLLFILAIVPAALYRHKRKHLWLVCEKKSEAMDNGYCFFKYLRKNHPEIDAVYAIDNNSKDYSKVSSIGSTVQFGSLKHWIYYLSAEVNISSQKDGKPDAAVCYFLEVVLKILKNKSVFLQHGVIKDDLPFLHRNKTGFSIFCCGALPEYEYVRDTFGYKNGEVQYLGLCRFDDLHNLKPDNALLLIIPTWRMDLNRAGDSIDFQKSAYYLCWKNLLEDDRFKAVLKKYNSHAVFCIHRNMQKFENAFDNLSSERIKVLRWQDAEIDSLIHDAGILITDYSSVAMDFAYMKRPIIYYQFDYEHYRKTHLPEGYFDYYLNGFGHVVSSSDKVTEEFERIFTNPDYYKKLSEERTKSFFTLYDTNNCKRTYEAIERLIQIHNE